MNNRNLYRTSTSRRGSWLIGCGVTLVVLLVIAIVGTIFIMNSWRGWTAAGSKKLVAQALNESSIQQVEKDEIMAHIDTLMTRFEEKKISFSDLGKVISEVMEGPLLPTAITAAAQHQYIASSMLTDEQKADARVQLTRVAQGIYEEKITNNELGTILAPIEAPVGAKTSTRIKLDNMDHEIALKEPQDVTNEELLTLIENARAKADETGIGPDPEPVDLSNEVAIAIARALGEDPTLWLPAGVRVPDERATDDNANTDDTQETGTASPDEQGAGEEAANDEP